MVAHLGTSRDALYRFVRVPILPPSAPDEPGRMVLSNGA